MLFSSIFVEKPILMKKILLFLLLAIFLTSCFFKTKDNKETKEPQEPQETKEVKENKDDNMKWTAKYNFMDLYKKRNHGFNPGSDKELSLVFSPMENVIILGAQKDTPNFDPHSNRKASGTLYLYG